MRLRGGGEEEEGGGERDRGEGGGVQERNSDKVSWFIYLNLDVIISYPNPPATIMESEYETITLYA